MRVATWNINGLGARLGFLLHWLRSRRPDVVALQELKLVDEKFPDNTESGWKLGFYAASRASQLRRMRAPRPQVNRGDKVT